MQNRTRTPTVLCDRIKGYPEGFRVLINPLKNPRQMARALNLDPGISTKRELTDAWRKMLKGYGSPIPPQWVDSGPILENVDEKDKVWLTDFGANAVLRFDPDTEQFESFPSDKPNAAVRQLLGRPGEV